MANSTRRAALAAALGLVVLAPVVSSAASAADPQLHHSAGTTLHELTQQAAKAQRGHPDKQMNYPKPDQPSVKGSGTTTSMPPTMAGVMDMSGTARSGSNSRDVVTPAFYTLAASTVAVGPTGLAPATGGQWTDAAAQLPTASVHTTLLNTGKVLIVAGSSNQYNEFAAGHFTSVLWNPVDNSMKSIPTPYDMFCNGHVLLRDGRLLILGGTVAYPQYDQNGKLINDWKGSKHTYIFDPISESYSPASDMSVGRWYPGVVRLGDDRVVAVGGLDETGHDTAVNEVFTPNPNAWDSGNGGSWAQLPTRPFPQYAHLILAADGRLFYTGESTGDTGQSPGMWNPTTGAWQDVNGLPNLWQRNAGASVLLPPAQQQRVMVIGGGDYSLPTLRDTNIVDLTATNPTYQPGPPILNPKMYVGAVILPDRTVLQTNGASQFRANAVHDAQVYDPATNAWTTMNSPGVDRLYHSTALLLPDGRVATFGSQVIGGQNELRISTFSPTYLFKGQRPAITSGPTYLNYDPSTRPVFTVTMASRTSISTVSLVRPSATTHSTDNEQRLIDVPFTRPAANQVSIQLPTNRNLLPPGWYMLNVVDSKGRPSASRWISVN